jgi:hypothetical protein
MTDENQIATLPSEVLAPEMLDDVAGGSGTCIDPNG